MRNLLKTALATFAVSALLVSCDRSPGPLPAGLGGGGTVKVTPQHHGANINDCKVYIKYNAKDKPSRYDDSASCVMVNGKPVATFKALRKGNYYFYGRGYDPNIAQSVSGGLPFVVTSETAYDIILPVTEVHTN